MSLAWSSADLVQGALVTFFQQRLAGGLDVIAGWLGNRPLSQHPQGILCIEVGDPARTLSQAAIKSITPPAGNAVQGSAIYDYGHERLPITANLYVRDSARGKTRRAEQLRVIEQYFVIEEGQPQHILLQLNDGLDTTAYITLESIHRPDTAEGLAADEWRAIIKMEARLPLRTSRTQTFCKDIRILPETHPEDAGTVFSVASVVEDSGDAPQ